MPRPRFFRCIRRPAADPDLIPVRPSPMEYWVHPSVAARYTPEQLRELCGGRPDTIIHVITEEDLT